MEMYRQALEIHEASGNKKGMGSMYNNIGLLYFNKSDFYQAITFHQKCLDIFIELQDSSRIATIHNNIGVDYQYVSDYPKALDYFLKAQALYEAKENPGSGPGLANTLSNIGIIYKNIGQYDSALVFQNRALEAYTQIKNKQGMAAAYGNIGVVYDLLSRPADAIEFYLKALQLNEASGNPNRMASDFTNLGAAYIQLPDHEKGFRYLLKARDIYRASGDRNNLALVLLQIGDLYRSAPDSFLKQHHINPAARQTTALHYQKEALEIICEHVWRKTLALWTICNDLRFVLRARSNALRTILSEPLRVITRSVTARLPSSSSLSIPEYRPSVFSRTITRSMFGRDEACGMERVGLRFAYNSSA